MRHFPACFQVQLTYFHIHVTFSFRSPPLGLKFCPPIIRPRAQLDFFERHSLCRGADLAVPARISIGRQGSTDHSCIVQGHATTRRFGHDLGRWVRHKGMSGGLVLGIPCYTCSNVSQHNRYAVMFCDGVPQRPSKDQKVAPSCCGEAFAWLSRNLQWPPVTLHAHLTKCTLTATFCTAPWHRIWIDAGVTSS